MTNTPDNLKTLVQVENELHGSLIVSSLKEAGIHATLTGVFTAGFRAEAPGYVSVIVEAKDLAKAQEILKTIETSEPVDWSQVDVGEPED
ncbi:MAG: DUF2007 domain-containing protein [Pirellulaceae bacterium]|nr:DUF2007 domain-containing protein [Pirellulaceae bacterium]